MGHTALLDKANEYVQDLSTRFPSRRVGSPANQAASAYIRSVMEGFNLSVSAQRFECQDHFAHGIELTCGGRSFNALISPHSLGCHLSAELGVAADLPTLQSAELEGKILLLKDELTKEQLMPKNFTFYNPEQHQQLIALLESKAPAAILTATGKNPEAAGALYPFPMIEDGDFDIPSAYLTDLEGEQLAEYAGKSARLVMDAGRIPSWAENVVASIGSHDGARVVICAHLDAKQGTPGAVDNACGVAVLLLLAELLKEYRGSPRIELVALNGEDHYSAGGEMSYLRENEGKLASIQLTINIDGVGYQGHPSQLSFYGCSGQVESSARQLLSTYPFVQPGEAWYQSDHMVFAMNQVPAMALTTSAFMEMETEIAHTEADTPDKVDAQLLVETALFLRDMLVSEARTVHNV